MRANVGNLDRVIRLILGIVILALGYYYSSWWGLIGLIPVGTAVFGRCGLYSICGMTTRKAKEKPAEG